ncbi:MAG: hypothetical protein HYS74_01585 [Parcubacteria group bacterium]|nr:hypothetical protein [Parcubacteria group bacterium]
MFRYRSSAPLHEIAPDEILLDSHNLPQFDRHQFEGRLERPISRLSFVALGALFLGIALLFTGQAFSLQVVRGEELASVAEYNRLRHTPVFAERGVIFDRNGVELAWNESFADAAAFSRRRYIEEPGFAHLLGFVQYPSKDASGFYYHDRFVGRDGVERFYDDVVGGKDGTTIVETNARGEIISQNVFDPPVDGTDLILSVDARIEERLYRSIADLAHSAGFLGGAGVMLDVLNGEVLALVSYPEYDATLLSEGGSEREVERYTNDERTPFLNRAIGGLYIPGSIVKPVIALGALNEGVINPDTKILSTGSISVPNPYDRKLTSVFTDWKAHGWVAMREALAVSSNVYFYEISGGYQEQRGIGIEKLASYMKQFGYGSATGIDLFGEAAGVVPTPAWKEEIFNDPWRIGDTYNTAIGQYGFQITPIQAARVAAAVANDGVLVTPRVSRSVPEKNARIPLDARFFAVVREGMREAIKIGTAQGLNIPSVSVAAKTGTAEVGVTKKRVNSWVIGFFPYESPRYAFAVVMERGPRQNLVGALYVMRELLSWMAVETPEYLAPQPQL